MGILRPCVRNVNLIYRKILLEILNLQIILHLLLQNQCPSLKLDTCFAKLKYEARSKNNVNFCKESLPTLNNDVGSEFMNTPLIVGTDVLNRKGVCYVRTHNSQRITTNNIITDEVINIESEFTVPVNTPLQGDQLQQLLSIIREFSEYFITSTTMTTVDKGVMSIKLNNYTLINYRPYHHVLIVVDAFSKFCLLYPIYKQDANELKQNVTNVISLFGTPKLIVTDRGRSFQSTDFLAWVKDMGCDVHLITPEMHQSNGQAERYCRTVLNMIRIECNFRQHEWLRIMWKIQLILNITKHRTTQCSALNLLVGIDAATPLIRSLVRDVALGGSNPNREALRKITRQGASERLSQNRQKQDAYVNKGRKPAQAFNFKSLVFVRKQAQSTGKLDSCMRGPYRVIKVLPHGRYELQLLAASYGKSTQASAEFMIPWRGEWTPDVCSAFFDGEWLL